MNCKHHIDFKACEECRLGLPAESGSEFLRNIPRLAPPQPSEGRMTARLEELADLFAKPGKLNALEVKELFDMVAALRSELAKVKADLKCEHGNEKEYCAETYNRATEALEAELAKVREERDGLAGAVNVLSGHLDAIQLNVLSMGKEFAYTQASAGVDYWRTKRDALSRASGGK